MKARNSACVKDEGVEKEGQSRVRQGGKVCRAVYLLCNQEGPVDEWVLAGNRAW